jgi:hypothetical protein
VSKPSQRRREERLRLEAEALGMTLPEARLWWATQKHGYFTGRVALREREKDRLWAEGAPARAAAKAAREERLKNGTGTVGDYITVFAQTFADSMRQGFEDHLLHGSGPRTPPPVWGIAHVPLIDLHVSKPYRPAPLGVAGRRARARAREERS